MIDLIRRHPRDRPAVLGPGADASLSYGELMDRVDDAADRLRVVAEQRALVFLALAPDPSGVVLYLACLQARLPLCLAETQAEPFARLARTYAPKLLLLPDALAPPDGYRQGPAPVPGYRAWVGGSEPVALHPDLALLLTTSGSTGNPKLVRLTAANLEANALAIGEYLGLGPDERAIQSLPMHYSYGLSVLNSHLVAGGSVVLTVHSFIRPEFWAAVDEARCTSFAGVPYMYETLHRLRRDPGRHRSLRALTQAGGGLRRELVLHFMELAQRADTRLFVMYGQTEATARISYVPPEHLPRKIGSIGIAIPGGRLRLAPVDGSAQHAELVYEGPNVMMGYAEGPADLALGDVQGGVLRTGDLGTADADGYHSVVGRLKRFAKLFGRRVSLEDVEREVESAFPVRAMAADGGDRIVLVAEQDTDAGRAEIARHVARFLGVPPAAVEVRIVDGLPRTSTGKKDYSHLEAPR